ncbi:MAG: exonuclease domain-containing protein [Patescibacteria group bacterium]
MQKLIFFDTETTGNTESDFLCQLGYKIGSETFSHLYKPPKPIPPEASAVHHITNKMVEERPYLKDSGDLPKLKEIFEAEDAIVVAHNAPFDLMIVKKENIKPKNFICTLRVARHLDNEGKIGRYNLQYLRYLLNLDVEANAHDALGDVLVLEKLFEHHKKELMEGENLGESETIVKMMEISSQPSIIHIFPFGKHNGKRVDEVVKIDKGYLEWLLGEKLKDSAPDEDWIYTLKHYLQKNKD